MTNLILNQSSTILGEHFFLTIQLKVCCNENIFGLNLDENVNALESVYGRKNPSTTQAKQLKKCIPNVSILKVLIISQVNLNFFFFAQGLSRLSFIVLLSIEF